MPYVGQTITEVFPTSISVDSATISGNTTIGGTLGVTGATTLSNQLTDANMSAGSVLQVVNASTTTEVSTTSDTFIDTGLTASITPSSTSSKILVLYTLQQFINASAGVSKFKLFRASTELILHGFQGYAGGSTQMSKAPHQFLDSPSTTSATTYKVQFNSAAGGHNVVMQYDDSNGDGFSEITLMEIAG